MRFISYLFLFALIFCINACRDDAIKVVDLGAKSYYLTENADTIKEENIELIIPSGSVNDSVEIAFSSRWIDDLPLFNDDGDAWFFRCVDGDTNQCRFHWLWPNYLILDKEIILKITEDKRWMKVKDGDGKTVDYSYKDLRIFKVNTIEDTLVELPALSIEENATSITVSAKINEFGFYQIGVPYDSIKFYEGYVKGYMSGFRNDSFYIDVIDEGVQTGIASLYLSSEKQLRVTLFDEQSYFNLLTKASSVGVHHVLNSNTEDLDIALIINNDTLPISSLPGDSSTIEITKLEGLGGIVEGRYSCRGFVDHLSLQQWVDLNLEFSSRIKFYE